MIHQCDRCLRILTTFQTLTNHKNRKFKCLPAIKKEKDRVITIKIKGITVTEIKKLLGASFVEQVEPEPNLNIQLRGLKVESEL